MLQQRFVSLLAERGWTQEFFAQKSGLPLNTVKNIATGKTKDPHLSTLEAAADAFEISINCLIGKCPHTPKEKAILRNYRECGEHGKANIELVARYEAGAIKEAREAKNKHLIPCIIPHGDVYNGIIYESCETEQIETATPEAYIAIKMMTNDFAPKYCKDDLILFENRFPSSGEYAAFLRGDRVYIRKFIEEPGAYRLKCLHDHGEDIILKRMDEIQYIGTAAGVMRQ